MGYLGSKGASGAYQAIIAAMPVHDTYIEPFVGSGVVLLRKPRALRTVAADLDGECLAALPDWVEARHDAAESVIAGFDYAGSRTLIYADPPYPHSTRTSRKRYRFEMSDGDHRRLLTLLRSVPAKVMISSYPSALYAEELAGWRCLTFQVMTRGGPRTECLWCNFGPDEPAYSHTFAGRNFTERQRIKRKAARWLANYSALPPGEQLAVLSAIVHSHAQLCAIATAGLTVAVIDGPKTKPI